MPTPFNGIINVDVRTWLSAPTTPRTMYPGSWADRYRGRFDMGYERYRELTLEEFTKTREEPKFVANGTLRLYIRDRQVAEGPMPTQPGKFRLGEGCPSAGTLATPLAQRTGHRSGSPVARSSR